MLGRGPRSTCVILRKNLQSHLPASAEKGQLPGIWNLPALSCMGGVGGGDGGERIRTEGRLCPVKMEVKPEANGLVIE